MNTQNNQRYRNYESQIQTALLDIIESVSSHELTVNAICAKAKINRSTFYAHYKDIVDLLVKVEYSLRKFQIGTSDFCTETGESLCCDQFLLRLLTHIKKYRKLYQAYFRYKSDLLPAECFQRFCFGNPVYHQYQKNNAKPVVMKYHSEFCNAGFHAIIHQWVGNECAEQPRDILHILQNYLYLSMG